MGALISKLEYAGQQVVWGADAQSSGSTNQPQKIDSGVSIPKPANSSSRLAVGGQVATDIGNLGAPLGIRGTGLPAPVAALDKGPTVWDIAGQQANGYDVAVMTPNTNNIQPLQKTESTPINSQTISREVTILPPDQGSTMVEAVSKRSANNITGGSQTASYNQQYSHAGGPVMDHPRTILAQARVDPNPPGMTKGSVRPPGAGDWLGNLLSSQTQQQNVAMQRPMGNAQTLASGSGVFGPVYSTMKQGYQRIANPAIRMPYQL